MSEIDNYVEVIHALSRFKNMKPDGSYDRVLVNSPRANNGPPEYLRLSVPRKGCTFKVIEKAKQFGLSVKDVWQYNYDKEEDRIMINIAENEGSN
jgi:hypothetical protein